MPKPARYFCRCGEAVRFYSVSRKRWVGDRQHTLCRRCWRAVIAESRNHRKVIGTVRSFSVFNGYGFIAADGQDVFVHCTAVDGCSLAAGDTVEFESRVAARGIRAVNVRRVA